MPDSKVYLKNSNEPDSKPTESLDEYAIDKDGTIYGLDDDTAIYYPLQEQYKLVDDKRQSNKLLRREFNGNALGVFTII